MYCSVRIANSFAENVIVADLHFVRNRVSTVCSRKMLLEDHWVYTQFKVHAYKSFLYYIGQSMYVIRNLVRKSHLYSLSIFTTRLAVLLNRYHDDEA